jgi:hypothetical protein
MPAQAAPAPTTASACTPMWNTPAHTPSSYLPLSATLDAADPASPHQDMRGATAPAQHTHIQSMFSFELPRDPPTIAPTMVDDSADWISSEELKALQPLRNLLGFCRGIPHTTRRQQMNPLFKRMKHMNALVKTEKKSFVSANELPRMAQMLELDALKTFKHDLDDSVSRHCMETCESAENLDGI